MAKRKKDKQQSTKHYTQKTKDWVTRTPLKTTSKAYYCLFFIDILSVNENNHMVKTNWMHVTTEINIHWQHLYCYPPNRMVYVVWIFVSFNLWMGWFLCAVINIYQVSELAVVEVLFSSKWMFLILSCIK
jgi:hypothetical protein